jgi:hypothetical protein
MSEENVQVTGWNAEDGSILNGSHNGRAASDRVSFGPLPTQTVPARWAAWMLTAMRDDEVGNAKRRQFSDYLQAATVHFLMNGGE